ncbi:ORF6N domain-containing protein [Alistipes indistinctus]|uniref:ORF6N domain-containing protein n=1 Tax=Alistipes indistinctus TaxID=626932 RepID=UPI0015F1DCC9|nr:ORF6N domain-containing protein [Alistipes indistinctus]BCD55450.1 hypothetical protein AI2BBH_P480 [Alistipes indistinctus]
MKDLTSIQTKIYEIRGQRVMLDFDLAELYQVETRSLKQAVRRNIERFPEDFMFRLTKDESNYLINIGKSQNVIPPDYNIGSTELFAFTEMGVAMLSSVLRSKTAIQANIVIMRAFVAMRNYLLSPSVPSAELDELRRRVLALERGIEDTNAAINDLSEDNRQEFDDVYMALAALAEKKKETSERPVIGYKKN